MPISRFWLSIAAFCILAGAVSAAIAEDWPMWRCDAARSGASPDSLPGHLYLRWSRQMPRPRPAWPASQAKLQFDAVHQPVVVGKLVFVASSADDSVVALDVESGNEKWRFYANGPIRFAPAATQQKVVVASDDGYLYCLAVADGKLLWKFRGGPDDRPIIGNDRLISSWPIRGGPVIADNTVYFTAGIWPFMGIFVHAVDLETGVSRWVNSETGSRWITHPHGAPSFGSIVPQGYLSVAGDNLIVPGGRSLPAVFDRDTGELRHFDFGGKRSGGWSVVAHDNFYSVGNDLFSVDDGSAVGSAAVDVLTDDLMIAGQTAYGLDGVPIAERESVDSRGRKVIKRQFKPKRSWTILPDKWQAIALAGDQIYAANGARIARFSIVSGDGADAKNEPSWSAEIDGRVANALVANERLFVVTERSELLCFGGNGGNPRHHELEIQPIDEESKTPSIAKTAKAILSETGVSEGYAIAIGVASGHLIEEIVLNSELHVIVLDADGDNVAKFRRRMTDAGLYGSRVTARQNDIHSITLPPYLASLIFSEAPLAAIGSPTVKNIRALYSALRPYGGAICLPYADADHLALIKSVEQSAIQNAVVSRADGHSIVRRDGPLPGSGSWTHQYADAGNSVVSQDRLVKAPLGLLWFGGPPNDKVLPRHGHGPSPQVAGGRLVIEGADMLRCVDVYTGRVLWERDLPGLGTYYNVTSHFAGAGEIGSNYVTMPDAVYVVYGVRILKLDPDTGETLHAFTIGADTSEQGNDWGFIAVSGGHLVATLNPAKLTAKDAGETAGGGVRSVAAALEPTRYAAGSRKLVVFDRHDGELLWTRDAQYSFRHNCIAAGNGKVFCIDNLSSIKLQVLKRRGIEPSAKPRLLALDIKSGEEIWSTDADVFGTFLSYSSEHDVLLQAGSAYRDRAKDEIRKGMVAYQASDGTVLWSDLSRGHGGPCLLWKDKIVTNGSGGSMFELLTGEAVAWKYDRMYGCNTAVGSQNLLTFRSGAAGYFDMAGDSGTGNIGGFRSSCTANLIVADGVLNAPDYTRTCTCAYQNQCSLGLIHMPEAEMWTFSSLATTPESRGINIGGPGDRRAANGTMWFDLPSIGGASPKLQTVIAGDQVRYVRRHSSEIQESTAETLPWVASSAAVGVTSIERKMNTTDAQPMPRYTVNLHFAELENLDAGERVFDVAVNGITKLRNFDIVKAAGGNQRGIVKSFRGITANGKITITLTPRVGEACICGVEILAESRSESTPDGLRTQP